MGSKVSRPGDEEANRLRSQIQEAAMVAAGCISNAEVFVFLNGAGWSADSGLAVYRDVAEVPAYRARDLTYQDVCRPHWLAAEPELFWGFWGQCFNDYRLTDPHKGYEIVHHWVGSLYRHTAVAKQLQKMCREAEKGANEGPYEFKGRAGSFYIYTSNVDAHHYDWFPACEIRECHGNTELYQCAGSRSGMDQLSKKDDMCQGIWRAPMEYRFHVDKDTMLAPQAPEEAFEVVTNHWAPPGDTSDPQSVPCVGRVKGSARRFPLRHMRSQISDAGAASRSFATNHPVCPSCGGPARPAILMFGDYSWQDNDAQEERFETWTQQVSELAKQRSGTDSPLNVVLLEVGAGGNVTTVRRRSEDILENVLNSGADARLLRVNPDFPLADKSALDGYVVSLMGRGLECLEMINAFMGPAALGHEPPSMPPPQAPSAPPEGPPPPAP